MSSCPKCGAELRPNAKFCHSCGMETKTDSKADITPQKTKIEKKVRQEKPVLDIREKKSKEIITQVVGAVLPAVIGIIIIMLVFTNISGNVVEYSIYGMAPHEFPSYPADKSIVFSVDTKPFFLSSDPEVYWSTSDVDDFNSSVPVEFIVSNPVTGDVYEYVLSEYYYEERISVGSDVLIFEWINNNESQDAIIYADISYYPDITWVAAFIVIGIALIACSFIAVYTIIKRRKK